MTADDLHGGTCFHRINAGDMLKHNLCGCAGNQLNHTP